LIEALPAAVYTTDAPAASHSRITPSVELAGRRPEIGSDWCVDYLQSVPSDGTPLPHDQAPHDDRAQGNRPVRGIEAVAERPDGTRVPFIPYPTPLRE